MTTLATGCFGQSGVVERRDLDQLHQLDPLHEQLSDAVAATHHDGSGRIQIDKRDLDLTAVAGIHGARTVDNRKPNPRSQSRTRMDQADHSVRDRHRDARAHQGPLSGIQREVLRTVEINPGVAVVGAGGQRKFGIETDYCQSDRHGGTDYP